MTNEWVVVPNSEAAAVPSIYAELLEWYERTVGRPAVVVRSDNGVLWFKANALYVWALGRGRQGSCDGYIDLNAMAGAFAEGVFTLAEYAEFYAGIGYSLSGFCDIFGAHIWPDEGE